VIPPVELYIDAVLAGDTAAHVHALPEAELRVLHGYAVARVRENTAKGGIPAIIKWACALEAGDRYLNLKAPATTP
jgi:hypothetical protein